MEAVEAVEVAVEVVVVVVVDQPRLSTPLAVVAVVEEDLSSSATSEAQVAEVVGTGGGVRTGRRDRSEHNYLLRRTSADHTLGIVGWTTPLPLPVLAIIRARVCRNVAESRA